MIVDRPAVRALMSITLTSLLVTFAEGAFPTQVIQNATAQFWRYDPKSAERAGLNLRPGWGVRGIAWWNGKIYVGTVDGRLIAIDARNGRPVWSVQTFDRNFPARVNGAPRVYDGKVVIGFGGTTGNFPELSEAQLKDLSQYIRSRPRSCDNVFHRGDERRNLDGLVTFSA
jgi:hypothetical protein